MYMCVSANCGVCVWKPVCCLDVFLIYYVVGVMLSSVELQEGVQNKTPYGDIKVYLIYLSYYYLFNDDCFSNNSPFCQWKQVCELNSCIFTSKTHIQCSAALQCSLGLCLCLHRKLC